MKHFEPFRAALPEADIARRRPERLKESERANLMQWGYPYVFSTWFFHMTLTRRLSEAEKAMFKLAAEKWLAPALSLPRRVSDICVFTQSGPGAAFTLAERVALRG